MALKVKRPIHVLRLGIRCVVVIAILGTTTWSVLAIRFSSLPSGLAIPLAAAYPVAVAIMCWTLRRRFWIWAGTCAGLFLMVLGGWFSMRPSNQRNWQPDVAVLPYADIKGGLVTIHNIRNCDYRTEGDYTVRYETQTYDLDKLRSMDLFLVDWGLGNIAHTMFSFGFSDGKYICFSVETRKEIGESYSALRGFFRQYEIIYIAGDERDLVRLRTNFRKGETVRLYPLRPRQIDRVERFFMDYVERINELHERPQWYNALTENCMTSAYQCMRKDFLDPRWHWKMVFNGYFDELAYERGLVYTGIPFADLRKKSVINARALAAGNADGFSREDPPGIARHFAASLPFASTASEKGRKNKE